MAGGACCRRPRTSAVLVVVAPVVVERVGGVIATKGSDRKGIVDTDIGSSRGTTWI